ncbi:NADH-quinone oxidoreductase subunit J [Cohnella thailandensis]|uniref:NADH-quinone oxidoreductase subunit J n=1 Tax=Cohnella thailandensis TaxID=557557 RepID=A0A841T5Z1_9BACL|nr:NADH-quinone oxidoreductase subunit J [Cohnella thailandensis]MBP1971969.1 NADH-quinone oxidoreductase subunit J [Cohnella thailandensis]
MLNFNVDFTGEFFAFFLLAACAIVGAVLAINFTKVVHMALSLAFTFVSLAGLYVLLQAEFVAFVQVLLYVGAVTILMIFGIMMTKHQSEGREPGRPLLETLAAIGCLCLFGILFYAIRNASFPKPQAELPEDNTMAIGKLLYSAYAIPFELVSVLLTVAFIGAVALAKREKEEEEEPK